MCILIRRQVNWTSVGLLLTVFALVVPRSAWADQKFNDDVIICGSLNVGFDAILNRSFGFDTIILSENNLRIFFEDTSNTASFPPNDWRITINDSTNGGLSHFSIDDASAGQSGVFRIEAGADANSIYVDSTNRVGISKANPVVELHIRDGDSPAVRFEQDGSSGFTPQTWDLAGNEASFFLRDVTNGSSLPIRIRPSAPSSSIDIAGTTGDIGFGTGSPQRALHVSDNLPSIRLSDLNATTDAQVASIIEFFRGNTTQQVGSIGFITDANENFAVTNRTTGGTLSLRTNNTERLVIESGGDVGIGVGNPTTPLQVVNATCTGEMWLDTSTREAKRDIKELELQDAIQAFQSLTPVRFAYKSAPDEECVGFIAEDVPELVAVKNRKALSSMDIVAVLTKVTQEQQKTVEQLTARLNALEEKLAEK